MKKRGLGRPPKIESPAKRGPGRPPKEAAAAQTAKAKRGPGRPKGSKNKPKAAKRGRPLGSKNKLLKVRKRGRPLGSKNKKIPHRSGQTMWQKIQEQLSPTEYLPCSMIADKIGIHQKFVSAILTRKEQAGEVKKTRVKHEFKGYNKAFGYRLIHQEVARKMA